jgi:hypothetical protein
MLGMGDYEQLVALLDVNPWTPERELHTAAEMSAFVAKARSVAAEPSGTGGPTHVRRQHVVSQCVQANFTRDSAQPGANLRAIDLDLLLTHETYQPGEYSTRSTGFFPDFVVYDSPGSEALWGIIERCIPLAVAALEQGLPAEREQLIARCAVALHWTRRPTTKALAEQSFRETSQKVAAIAERALVVSGRPWPTPEEVEDVQADAGGTLEALHDNGALFRGTVERTYRRALSACRLGRIFILAAPDGAEFLIGDNPVVVHDMAGNHAPDMPLLELLSMGMPLTPRFMIKIERDGQGVGVVRRDLTRDEVDTWNRLQVVQAQRFVMLRPESSCLERIRRWAGERATQ